MGPIVASSGAKWIYGSSSELLQNRTRHILQCVSSHCFQNSGYVAVVATSLSDATSCGNSFALQTFENELHSSFLHILTTLCSFAYSSLPGPQSAGYDSAFPFPRAPSAHCLAVFAWYTRFLRGTNFRQDKDNLGGQQTFYKRKYVSLAQNCVTWIHFPISRALRTTSSQQWKSLRSD